MTIRLVLFAIAAGCGSKPAPPAAPPATPTTGEGEAAPFVQAARDALVGHAAPAVSLELLDGTRVDLAKVLGRQPIYLKFWATWCVPCRAQMPHLEATFRAHGDRLAVFAVDVGVNDPIEDVRAMVASKQLTVPVAFDRDGSAAEQFHLSVTPQHVLIDSAGVVRYVGHAVTPDLERALAKLVEPAQATTAVATPPAPTVATTLALDDGSTLDLGSRHAPIAMTFGALFCDSYIVDSRPAVGAACAAHVREVEKVHRAHPELTWITIAYPVWTAADDIADYRKRLGATIPIGIDHGNQWFRKFGVRDSFTTILLDGSGVELGRVGRDGAGLGALIDKLK